MKTLKNPFAAFGKIALILGGVFLAVFIIIVLKNHFQLSGGTMAFGINGAVWLILGIGFYLPVKISNRKGERLKKEGIRYDVQIEQLVPNYYIRIGGSSPVRAECKYLNQDNKICLVRSGLFLQNTPQGGLSAVVYVSRKDPRDYFVEISSKAGTDIEFDYDYR